MELIRESLMTAFVLGMVIIGMPSIVFGMFRFWQVFLRK